MTIASIGGKVGRTYGSGAAAMLALAMVSSTMIVAEAGADTRAGTQISNVATVEVTGKEGRWAITSNPVVLRVGERLDVALARADDTAVAIGAGGATVPVLLTNRGNGDEAFDLSAALSDASATVRGVAVDTDGDGRFGPADTLLVQGRTPPLAPGATLRLLVLVDAAADPVTAVAMTVNARAATGSGPQGTTIAGAGDGGGDAMTGATGAAASLVVPIGDAQGLPMLIKSQAVRAADGSTRAVAGAVITYTLEARFTRPAQGARLLDPIPAGTLYRAGSLTLDDTPVSDASGLDAGGRIAVALGDIAGPAVRTLRFQVTIQ